MPLESLKPKGAAPREVEPICLFAQTNYRNQMRRFGIKTDDRRRHMYVIGKTGMGKTTMLENMVLQDVYAGHGLGLVDPHGDFAEKILDFIPASRINDVVYINPSDVEFPIGFNILEVENEEQKNLVASGLMGIFKKIWPDVWSPRMEYILSNTLLALLDYPGATLLGMNRMLSDAKYRKRVVAKIKDPVVLSFWRNEFATWEDKYRKEAIAPVQNKVGQFLSVSIVRNMVAQVKSTINVRQMMDSGKIVIMNLSKGRMGEDNSRLLGAMIITKIQLAAMERVDIPEKDRKDFFLYVDEFQNFATESFANILSEARKYRLSLIMAHQYVAQLDEMVRDAVFGNVGTIVSFRVGAADAELLGAEFAPVFLPEDIVNLPKTQVYLKLMIDGAASQPFSAITMPPIGSPTGNADKVIRVSRERYAKPRAEIEDKINRWSGMDMGDGTPRDDADFDAAMSKKSEPPKSDGLKKLDSLIREEVSLKELIPHGGSKQTGGQKMEDQKSKIESSDSSGSSGDGGQHEPLFAKEIVIEGDQVRSATPAQARAPGVGGGSQVQRSGDGSQNSQQGESSSGGKKRRRKRKGGGGGGAMGHGTDNATQGGSSGVQKIEERRSENGDMGSQNNKDQRSEIRNPAPVQQHDKSEQQNAAVSNTQIEQRSNTTSSGPASTPMTQEQHIESIAAPSPAPLLSKPASVSEAPSIPQSPATPPPTTPPSTQAGKLQPNDSIFFD